MLFKTSKLFLTSFLREAKVLNRNCFMENVFCFVEPSVDEALLVPLLAAVGLSPNWNAQIILPLKRINESQRTRFPSNTLQTTPLKASAVRHYTTVNSCDSYYILPNVLHFRLTERTEAEEGFADWEKLYDLGRWSEVLSSSWVSLGFILWSVIWVNDLKFIVWNWLKRRQLFRFRKTNWLDDELVTLETLR